MIRGTFRAAIVNLTTQFGPNPADWKWGKLHTLTQKHVLSGRGDLGSLLDRSGFPMPGDNSTVSNATSDPTTHVAISGAGFRMIADLSDLTTLWAIEVAGASGHPGSPHYDDQIQPWLAGDYHAIPLSETPATTATVLTLQPRDS
jgi:penicillin amidase